MVELRQALPMIVSTEDWQRALDALVVEEKAVTTCIDALSAARRRLPMVKIDKKYRLLGSDGDTNLLDLFDGRRQLIVGQRLHRGSGCRAPRQPLDLPRPDSIRPTGNLGRLATRMAPNRDLYLATPSRRLLLNAC